MILVAMRGEICSDTQGLIKYTYPIENSTIPYSQHIQNIYQEGELHQESTIKKFLTVVRRATGRFIGIWILNLRPSVQSVDKWSPE